MRYLKTNCVCWRRKPAAMEHTMPTSHHTKGAGLCWKGFFTAFRAPFAFLHPVSTPTSSRSWSARVSTIQYQLSSATSCTFSEDRQTTPTRPSADRLSVWGFLPCSNISFVVRLSFYAKTFVPLRTSALRSCCLLAWLEMWWTLLLGSRFYRSVLLLTMIVLFLLSQQFFEFQ